MSVPFVGLVTSCPYFSMVAVGDKGCSFLMNDNIDSAVKESPLFCRVRMIPVLKRYGPRFTDYLNTG